MNFSKTVSFRLRFLINHVTLEIFPETYHEPLSPSPLGGGLNVFHEQSHQLKGCSRFVLDISL